MDKLVINSDFAKAHVNTFTRKDGAVVQAHDTKVQAATPNAESKAHHKWQVRDQSGNVVKVFHGEKSEHEAKQHVHKNQGKGLNWRNVTPEKASKPSKPSVPHLGTHAKVLRASSKPGDMDHDDNQYAADQMDAGDHKSLALHVNHLDTAARDHILDHVHPEHREKMGFKQIDPARSLKKYGEKFPAPKPKAKPAGLKPGHMDVSTLAPGHHLHDKNGEKVDEVESVEKHPMGGLRVHTRAGYSHMVGKDGHNAQGLTNKPPGPIQKSILLLDADLLKAHVSGYTRKDGAFVVEHNDKRQSLLKKHKALADVIGSIAVAKDGSGRIHRSAMGPLRETLSSMKAESHGEHEPGDHHLVDQHNAMLGFLNSAKKTITGHGDFHRDAMKQVSPIVEKLKRASA